MPGEFEWSDKGGCKFAGYGWYSNLGMGDKAKMLNNLL